nr:MAG TPA: hypothetical protein [Caudoviricetes sp.]
MNISGCGSIIYKKLCRDSFINILRRNDILKKVYLCMS